MKKPRRRRCQCGSCERPFLKSEDQEYCSYCGSGNWVYGYIDLPEPKWRKGQK